MRVAIVAMVVAWSAIARAGVCLGEDEANQDMALVEAFAKDKTQAKAVDDAYGWLCVELDAKRLAKRVARACRTILDRDGDHSPCVETAAAAGFAKLGDHDLFALVVANKDLGEDPTDAPGGIGLRELELLARMGDPRGAPIIVDQWKTAIPRAEAREKRHYEMRSWSGWRQRAADALGAIGDADTAAFLDDQAKATVDKHVAEACHDAAAAIRKRLGAK